MEPPQNTETATAPGPLPSTGPAGGGPPSEEGHEAGAAHEAEAAHETETAHEDEEVGPIPEAGTAHEAETAYAIETAHEAADKAGAAPVEESPEDAFYTMAAVLQLTLDKIEFECHTPIPVPDRRGEMTPGRVVHFEPAAVTPDRDRSKLGFGGGTRHFSMSPLTSTGVG
eukprot:819659-Rhodomonas_salina.1